MKIVKFKDGKYGIRRWTPLGYQFKDFNSRHWWSKGMFSEDCRTEPEKAKRILELMTDTGTPVKD